MSLSIRRPAAILAGFAIAAVGLFPAAAIAKPRCPGPHHYHHQHCGSHGHSHGGYEEND